VSRLTLLVILALWMSWSKGLAAAEPSALPMTAAVGLFLGGFAALIFGMRAWAALSARRAGDGSCRSLFRFQWGIQSARYLIPAWLGVGIYVLGWGRAVQSIVPWLYRWPSEPMHPELPQALLGIFPAMLAWVGLWWSGFPVEQALREQTMLCDVDDDLPVHAPPSFRETLGANFRLQILFTLVPVLFILVLRDLLVCTLGVYGVPNARGVENAMVPVATALVFVLSPELLRRVLHTERLPDSPLRRRLEQMCRDAGLKYRDILLWRTDDTMGNAAVMGILPQIRYVLLSDLLLETMSDRQIEAVFAHEIGHVVHKHLVWFGVYAIAIIFFMAGPGDQLLSHVRSWYALHYSEASWDNIEGLVATVICFGSFILAFGYLSPKFERQADVFAARTLERNATAEGSGFRVQSSGDAQDSAGTKAPTQMPYAAARSHVGEYGAGLVASALHRVAVINHIPVSARNWSHGSIAHRMRALHEMSAHPSHTGRFDRFMTRLYAGLIVCVCLFGAWTAILFARDNGATAAGSPTTPIMASPTAIQAGR
jgi:STE24 endopeptidase